MDPILQQAQALAHALAGDPRTLALRAARVRLEASPADGALQQRYHEVAGQISAREAAGQPIEPPMKREAASLTDQVRRSTVLKDLLRAHAEFEALMDGVSSALREAVEKALGEPPG